MTDVHVEHIAFGVDPEWAEQHPGNSFKALCGEEYVPGTKHWDEPGVYICVQCAQRCVAHYGYVINASKAFVSVLKMTVMLADPAGKNPMSPAIAGLILENDKNIDAYLDEAQKENIDRMTSVNEQN